MKVTRTALPGVTLIEPPAYPDERGFFCELYQARRYAAAGIGDTFVQDNISSSRRGVVRGLHLQHPVGQAKLVAVLEGEIFDVAVDVRVGSPRFGVWTSATLSADNRWQIHIPVGFAHGFCVLSDRALVLYKCSEIYAATAALTIAWNDPDLGITWPVREPILSAHDRHGLRLSDLRAAGKLPTYDSAV